MALSMPTLPKLGKQKKQLPDLTGVMLKMSPGAFFNEAKAFCAQKGYYSGHSDRVSGGNPLAKFHDERHTGIVLWGTGWDVKSTEHQKRPPPVASLSLICDAQLSNGGPVISDLAWGAAHGDPDIALPQMLDLLAHFEPYIERPGSKK